MTAGSGLASDSSAELDASVGVAVDGTLVYATPGVKHGASARSLETKAGMWSALRGVAAGKLGAGAKGIGQCPSGVGQSLVVPELGTGVADCTTLS